MAALRRRTFLAIAGCHAIGGLAGVLLAACGNAGAPPTTTSAARNTPGTPVAFASPSRPGPPSPVHVSPTMSVSSRPATPATPRATTAAITPTPITKLIDACPIITYPGTPRPEDPFGAQFEALTRPLYGFSEEIRRAQLILVGALREILPSRWNTVDGTRPIDIHLKRQTYFESPPIMTPLRLETERILAGSYAFATLYIAKARGEIGHDCFIFYSMFDSTQGLTPGQRSILFLYSAPSERFRQRPVPDDPRYRYYEISHIFPVVANDTVKFPALGETREFSYTYRTIRLDQAIDEITAVTTTPTPTPSR